MVDHILYILIEGYPEVKNFFFHSKIIIEKSHSGIKGLTLIENNFFHFFKNSLGLGLGVRVRVSFIP